jgi:hypothetical protein
MMADVVVVVPSSDDAKRLVTGYLKNQVWLVYQLDHVERMSEAPIHDARLGSLFRSAQKRGLAAELSPYG